MKRVLTNILLFVFFLSAGNIYAQTYPITSELYGITTNEGAKTKSKAVEFKPKKYTLTFRYQKTDNKYVIIAYCTKDSKTLRFIKNKDFHLQSDCANVKISGMSFNIVGNQWDYATGVYPMKGNIDVVSDEGVVKTMTFEVSPFLNEINKPGEKLNLIIAEAFPDNQLDLCVVYDKKANDAAVYQLPLTISVSGEDGKDGAKGLDGANGANGSYKVVGINHSNKIAEGLQQTDAATNPNSVHRHYTSPGGRGGDGGRGGRGGDGGRAGDITLTISNDGIEDKLELLADGGKGGKGGEGGQGGIGGVGSVRGVNGAKGLKGSDGIDGFDGKIDIHFVRDINSEMLQQMSQHRYLPMLKLEDKDFQAQTTDLGFEEARQRYDKVYTLRDGFAKVEKDDRFGFIDEHGKEVVAPTFANIHQKVHLDWLKKTPTRYMPIFTIEGNLRQKTVRWISLNGEVSQSYDKGAMFNLNDVIPDAVWDF